MQSRLVTNAFGQHFVLARGVHWLSGAYPRRPSYIDDEWSAGMFIRSLEMEPRQWRQWVDLNSVGPRYDERVYISAAIKELAQGRFNVYPVPQEEFLRTIPKICTFQNNGDPDDQLYEYAIIPSPVALIRPSSEPVPLIIARRLLQAWAATAGKVQLKQMLELLRLPQRDADVSSLALAALLTGLNAGVICLVRYRFSDTRRRKYQPELLPYVHTSVPLGPPESENKERQSTLSQSVESRAVDQDTIVIEEDVPAEQVTLNRVLERLRSEILRVDGVDSEAYKNVQKMRVIFDNSYDGLAVIDGKTGDAKFSEKFNHPAASDEMSAEVTVYFNGLSISDKQLFIMRHELEHMSSENLWIKRAYELQGVDTKRIPRHKNDIELDATLKTYNWMKSL